MLKKAIIVTFQHSIAKWFEYIAEPIIVDTTLDRFIRNANWSRIKRRIDAS